MAKRKRDIQLKVRVTPEERAMIEAKMAQLGTCLLYTSDAADD